MTIKLVEREAWGIVQDIKRSDHYLVLGEASSSLLVSSLVRMPDGDREASE